MALTYARVPLGEGALGNGLRFKILDITFDSSYATGGESMSGIRAAMGLNSIIGMRDLGIGGQGPYNFRYIPSTDKLQVLRGGVSEYTYTQGDIKGSVTVDVPIASGALPTNGQLLSTLADAANTTAFTIALQPDIPRNVGVSFKNTVAGASTGNATSVVIVGLFRGAAQTETISFTALELTSTAQNEVATKYGSKPFDSITSATPSAAQPASWQHALGPGSKLGLPVSTDASAEADIVKLFKNAADLAKTGLYSTNETVNFGTLADGDDISMIYRVSGGEVQNAATLATLTRRLEFIGN